MFFVYIIEDNLAKLYIGVSSNPNQRLEEHNSRRGAEFTKKGKFEIVFTEDYQTFAEARKREIQIKKWRREKKEALISRYILGLKTKK